jgi:hypothetical protein
MSEGMVRTLSRCFNTSRPDLLLMIAFMAYLSSQVKKR